MNSKSKSNPFRSQNSQYKIPTESEKKVTEWGKVKFNPVAKLASQESATPWSEFKTEIIQKQKKDAQQSEIDSASANVKQFNRIREENYRRNLIESKKNEPTKWEDFSEEPENKVSSKKSEQKLKQKPQIKGKFQSIPSVIKDFDSLNKSNFDSRQLTADQNNYLKKAITKGVMRKKGSFKQAVQNLKLQGVQKKSFKKRK